MHAEGGNLPVDRNGGDTKMASRSNTAKRKALKIAEVLKEGLKKVAPDVKVLVRRGYGRNFDVWVISEKWRSLSRNKRQDAADRALFHGLQDDYDLFIHITLLFALTPEEYEELKDSPYYVEEDQNLVKGAEPSKQTCEN